MYFLLIYDLVDNYIEKRTPYRPQHFEHVKAAQARGEFVMGGAFDPADQAGLLFKVDHTVQKERFRILFGNIFQKTTYETASS